MKDFTVFLQTDNFPKIIKYLLCGCLLQSPFSLDPFVAYGTKDSPRSCLNNRELGRHQLEIANKSSSIKGLDSHASTTLISMQTLLYVAPG